MQQKLGEHHRLIYQIIKENPGITSSKLLTTYRELCRRMGLRPKSDRSVSNYISTLLGFDLIRSERIKIRGNVRKFTNWLHNLIVKFSYLPSIILSIK